MPDDRAREEIAAALADALADYSAGKTGPEADLFDYYAQRLLPTVRALMAEAAAKAWDEGYRSGHSNAMRRMSDEPHAPTTPNPYRARALTAKEAT